MGYWGVRLNFLSASEGGKPEEDKCSHLDLLRRSPST